MVKHYAIIFPHYRYLSNYLMQTRFEFGIFNNAKLTYSPFPDQIWHLIVMSEPPDTKIVDGLELTGVQFIGDVKPYFVDYAKTRVRK